MAVPEISGTTTGLELLITVAASTSTYVAMDQASVELGGVGQDVVMYRTQTLNFSSSTSPSTVNLVTSSSNENGTGLFTKGTTAGQITALENINVVYTMRIYTSGSTTDYTGNIAYTINGSTTTCATARGREATWNLAATCIAYMPAGSTMQLTQSGTFDAASANTVGSIFASKAINAGIFSSQCGAACENEFSASVSNAGVVSGENADWINGNCAVTSTSVSTCTFNAGIFTVAPTCTVTNLSTNGITVFSSATTSSQFATRSANTSNTATAMSYYVICQKTGADYQASRTIAGSFKDTPKTIGSSGSDIQSVYFGSSADCSTACTTGTCTICNQVGNKISSVTWVSAGNYNLNGIDGAKYNCSGQGFSSGTSVLPMLHNRVNSTSSFARVTGYNVTATTNAAYVSIDCIGVP
jgi:hypothetical protein